MKWGSCTDDKSEGKGERVKGRVKGGEGRGEGGKIETRTGERGEPEALKGRFNAQ